MIYQTPKMEWLQWDASDIFTLSNGGNGMDNEINYRDLFSELEELS